MPKDTLSEEQIEKIRELLNVRPKNHFEGFDKPELVIPTPFEGFNKAIGYGGLPIGCRMEIHGPEFVGKTTLLAALLAYAQKSGHIASLIEPESAATNPNLSTLGVDLNALVTIQTLNAAFNNDKYNKAKYHGRSFEFLSMAINNLILRFQEKRTSDSKQCLVIGVDSAPALTPHKQIVEGINDSNYGLQTKMYTEWMKTLQALVDQESNVSIIFTNQERQNIGAVGPFARKWREALGPGYHYAFQVKVRLSHTTQVKSGDKIVGREHHGIIRKTKRGTEGRQFSFFTKESMGIWHSEELFTTGLNLGVIKKTGTNYKFGEIVLSKKEMKSHIKANTKEIRKAIKLFKVEEES